MDPPQNTLSDTASSRPLWHNLVEGSTFDISCYASYIKPNSDFTVEFYKDGVLLSNESLPQVDITSRVDNHSFELMLSFLSFTTAHNGLYICNVSSADRDLYATENYRIYRTGVYMHDIAHVCVWGGGGVCTCIYVVCASACICMHACVCMHECVCVRVHT